MRQVRNGVFETNSSSTHSLTICTEEEFKKWKSGELLFDDWKECFADTVTLTPQDKENAKEYYIATKSSYWKDWEQLSDEEVESWYTNYANKHLYTRDRDNLKTYNEWIEDYDLEKFEYSYITPSGDKIVAFGKYGYC